MKLSNTLCAIESADIENYPDNYAMLTTDAALRSELIACRMRHLLYGSTTTRKETYLASAGVVQGIRINENDGVLEITLPCLLPKRKQRQSTEFLIDPLYFTLSQYADSKRLPKYQQCVVCFSHMLLNKQTKVKIGYRYRFYFKETNRFSFGSEFLDSATSTDCFLGFEELGEYTEQNTTE